MIINTGEQPDICELCGPPFELARGGTLSLRHSTGADVDGLDGLYRSLQPIDRHRRFFSGGPPPPSFVERWATIEEHGGFGLVADLYDDGHHRIVGEAGYSLLGEPGQVVERTSTGNRGADRADGGAGDHRGAGDHGAGPGDGELGIAVAPDSRGWLGPWLLDRLLAHAHQRGVPNLQALILIDNRTMLAIAGKRGYAVLGHPDRGMVRITMATAGAIPGWPARQDRPTGGSRPRVLIETDHSRWIGEQEMVDAGFDIVVCAKACRTATTCPALRGEPCPLIEGADVVVIDLPDSEQARDLLHHELLIHPGLQPILASHRRAGDDEGRTADDYVLEVRRRLAARSADEDNDSDSPDSAGFT